MSDATGLVATERWIPYASVGFADGRILLLEPFGTDLSSGYSPIVESTLDSYFEYHPTESCGLTEMWRYTDRGRTFSGGGGGFEEDGYAALFAQGILVWIVFLTDSGPLRYISHSDSYLTVAAEDDRRLWIDLSEPFRIESQPD